MKRVVVVYTVYFCVLANFVSSHRYHNDTIPPDATSQQLPEFRDRQPDKELALPYNVAMLPVFWERFHKKHAMCKNSMTHLIPIGLFTKITGEPMDLRDTVTLNTEIFDNRFFFRVLSHQDRERIPERVVHAKGNGAFGYFEVTHDVSKYTKADVFNGIGKKTPVMARFSISGSKLGASDVARDVRSISLKMYTKEGNLDYVTFHIPIFMFKDPITFAMFIRSTRSNPRANILSDLTMLWDLMTLRPELLLGHLFFNSDLGIPDGYRKADYFPIHTYELYNKHGERFFAKFNFRTETGLYNLTVAETMAIGAEDPDYYGRDLYDAIAAKQYPSWRLDMDILTADQITKVNYDPFDITRLWKRGTYRTVTIGRLVLNRRVDNHFKDVEQAAFTPDNLVPGISGPADQIFKSRRLFYPDTHNYRLGVNHVNIPVNAPLNKKTYGRDGKIPALDNMRDAPNFYPNSFKGPVPYVDEARPKDLPKVLHSNAIDLQPVAEFYNEILESDAHRQRLSENVASSLALASPIVQKRGLRLLTLVDVDFGRRVNLVLEQLRQISSEDRLDQLTQCFSN